MSVARRTFLSTSGLGAAAVGVAALTPELGAGRSAAGLADSGVDTAALSGPLVAFVSDVRAGEVSLMVGENEILVQDKELVNRLLRAAAK